jgi:hypothetical protein
MRNVPFLFAAALLAARSPSALNAAEAPKPAVVGLQVMRPGTHEASLSIVPGERAGTTLWLLVTLPDRHIVGLDETASKITAFADDKGTDLNVEERNRFWHKPVDCETVEDGRGCVLAFRSPKLPAANARTLALKATVVLLHGIGDKTAAQASVALKEGAEIKVGPFPMKIMTLAALKSPPARRLLTLEGSQEDRAIRSFAFIGPDGKDIGAEIIPGRRVGAGSLVHWYRPFALPAGVENVTLRITYFERLESITVPIEITAGIGF